MCRKAADHLSELTYAYSSYFYVYSYKYIMGRRTAAHPQLLNIFQKLLLQTRHPKTRLDFPGHTKYHTLNNLRFLQTFYADTLFIGTNFQMPFWSYWEFSRRGIDVHNYARSLLAASQRPLSRKHFALVT